MGVCNIPTKICTKCGNEHPATNEYFYCDKNKKDGFRSECKKCHRNYYKNNRSRYRQYYIDHADRHNKNVKKCRGGIKLKVINHYGGKCTCCGEAELIFLTIDHINGGGRRHRKEKGGLHFYIWLIHNNSPRGFQVLCWNCNYLKYIKHLRSTNIKTNITKSYRRYGEKLKRSVINHYGGKCACCGNDNIDVLTIDHINGGGSKHLLDIGIKGGKPFYLWIIRNNFPIEFQVLCYNCNCARAFYTTCPHQRSGG